VPLVPVQLVESAVVAMLVLSAGALAISHATRGSAFALYVEGYAIARFGLEFLRGDPLRLHWRGLSEAQWTSVGLSAGCGALEVVGVLPGGWPAAAPAGALAAVAVALARPGREPGLLHPSHVQEVARAVRALSLQAPDRVSVLTTSAGVNLSCGHAHDALHIAISSSGVPLTSGEAATLASVIATQRPGADVELIAGIVPVWHVLLRG
jgi:hypothetical protein